MKQVAIAIVLSVLLYCYSLIMGTSDAVLPWALKILMIALVTVAVFIYRKPFQHLFSAVGYGTIGSTERAEYSLREAGSTFRRSTLDAATVTVPGVAGYRAARWARRNPGQAAAVAAGVASGAGAGVAGTAASADAAARAGTVASASSDAYASRLRPDAPPPADGEGEASTGSRRVVSGVGAAGKARKPNMPEAASGGGRVAPPLDLPPRSGGNGPAGAAGGAGSSGAAGSASGWSRGAGRSASAGPGPRTRAASSGSSGSSRVSARSGSAGSAPPISRGSGASGGSRGSRGSGASGGSRGSGGSGGSRGNNGGSGPAWPSSGWPAVSARQRSGAGPKPTPAPAEPADRGGQPARGRDQDDQPSVPFWLRPIRRDK